MARFSNLLIWAAIFSAACFQAASPAEAIEIIGVQPAALDQPQINMLLRRTPDGAPLSADFGIDGSTICVQAYFDTGASGILLSRDTAEALGVNKSLSAGSPVVFADIGVGGSQEFHVSEPLYVGLAPFVPTINTENPANYTQTFGPLRTQISMEYALAPTLAMDVVGMPAMAGKVVVMDPRPVENIFDFLADPFNPNVNLDINIHTSVHEPSDPTIPATSHHVALSYGDFSRFTSVTPTGEAGPTLGLNPFIGPNPTASLDGGPTDSTPGVSVAFAGLSTTGSFLFDTGATASMISSELASRLNVRYLPGTENSTNPLLETFDPTNPEQNGTLLSNQFKLTVSGVGGDKTVAGFFLDSLLLPTLEAADPMNPQDLNNIRFLGAPVLVSDIILQDPITMQQLTLDGILGMNFLVASAEVIQSSGLPSFGLMSPGAFNWIVFNEPAGILGLDYRGILVPEPATLVLLALAEVMFFTRRRLKR